MAYNKAKEERKWRIWKELEVKKMRQLGVSEDTIEKLRVHDWAIFNSERRYYQKLQDAGTYLDEIAENSTQPEVKTVEEFLDNIEDERLYRILITVDKLTLNMRKDDRITLKMSIKSIVIYSWSVIIPL